MGKSIKKLSEILGARLNNQRIDGITRVNQTSLIYFTDLSPLNQKEIDYFWEYPGSELERKIALRLATRTAEEALRALTAKWSGTNAPCHKCGLPKVKCDCLVSCKRCWVRHYKDSQHTCDEETVEAIASDPWGNLFSQIRQ